MGFLDERSRTGGFDEIPLPGGDSGDEGRLWLAGKHFVGPDVEAALERVGATTVVCLNHAHEIEDRYPDYVDWLRANAGTRAVWFPIHDLSAPPVETAAAFLAELDERLRAGEHLLVHCGAGIGRAGTIAAGLLVHRGLPVGDAVATVASSRPSAGPEAGAQSELLADLARRWDPHRR